MQVVLVTGWPKEETWDGEVGRDINAFNVEHYISLYMNVWLNLAAPVMLIC